MKFKRKGNPYKKLKVGLHNPIANNKILPISHKSNTINTYRDYLENEIQRIESFSYMLHNDIMSNTGKDESTPLPLWLRNTDEYINDILTNYESLLDHLETFDYDGDRSDYDGDRSDGE